MRPICLTTRVRIFVLSIFVLFPLISYSQSLFEIKWTNNIGSETKCLFVYFSEEECFARVAFHYNEKYYVVNVAYDPSTGVYKDESEHEWNYFLLQGKDAKYITEPLTQYNPDNFVWFWDNDFQDELPSVSDDPKLLLSTFKQTDSYKDLEPADITESYLRQFFTEDEEVFLLLKRMYGLDQSFSYDYSSYEETTDDVTMHVIIVANTEDPNIGVSCKFDELNLNNQCKDLCKILEIKYDPIFIEENSFSKSSVINALNNLTPGANDIVVFYYSGHGFRWSDQSSDWPQMCLTSNTSEFPGIEKSLNLSDVYKMVVAKGARLNLILGDCCNSDIGANQMTQSSFLASRASQQSQYTKLYKLFISAKGNIISAAAQSGEYSWSSPGGGYFTISLLQSIREEISYLTSVEPDWTHVIDNALILSKSKTSKENCAVCIPQNGIRSVSITY